MRLTKYISIFTIFFLLTSCFKEDIKVNPPSPGEVETVTIEIGYPYKNQVFYNCEQNKIISTNSKFDWDIGFETGVDGKHVKLNTAKGVLSSNQGSLAFDDVNSVTGITWQWDASNGYLDSTAIGDWFLSSNTTYIIDLQSDEFGNNLGYKKVVFESVNDTAYVFTYANLDGSNLNTFSVIKDNSINFMSFSFANGGEVKQVEPPKTEWDLCFTNYQHFFSNLPLPFVITGALSNRYSKVKIAEDNNSQFSIVQLSDTLNYEFTDYADEIGYDWKIRNSADNSFTIDENKSYILKNKNGLFYKIRFIDFYNSTGSKGYPKFEIQKL